MAKYLVEVSHSPDRIECLRSIQILLSTGNHFLTNAEWGCHDGVHKAWFIMDGENKEEAIRIIPPLYRKDTTVTELGRFRLKDVEEILNEHSKKQ